MRGRYGTQNQDFSHGACDGEVDYPGDSSMSASNPIELASEIVAAFVSNNPLPKGELPSLILAVHTAIVRLAAEPERVAQ